VLEVEDRTPTNGTRNATAATKPYHVMWRSQCGTTASCECCSVLIGPPFLVSGGGPKPAAYVC
jgi:hypothetical protein